MKIKKIKIRIIFRYLWLALALALLLYILSKNIITARRISYQPDFAQSISADVVGWYPESRTRFLPDQNILAVDAEPLYLKIYSPIKFKVLTVEGNIGFGEEEIRLGLKESDGSWQWQRIASENFSLKFPLDSTQQKRNQLEMIVSIPGLSASSTVYFENNWKFILSR